MINIISRSVGRCKSLHSEVARHTHRVAVIKSTQKQALTPMAETGNFTHCCQEYKMVQRFGKPTILPSLK